MKLQILAILTQFWPVLGPKWPQYQSSKLAINTVHPIVTGLSEIMGKILIDTDFWVQNADFGHFSPFLASFWPVKALVIFDLVLTGFNEIDQKILKNNDCSD